MKLESFVKLSGGKGFHVVLPIADADWDAAKTFTQTHRTGDGGRQPEALCRQDDEIAARGRIFIDYFRNSREATSVAPYSSRARAGAPVSAPCLGTIGRTTSGNDFTVLNLKKRLRSDPWAEIGKVRQKLPEMR